MRRSRAVPIATLTALALAFGACGDDDEETAYCVDEENQIVDNSECDERSRSYGGGFFWVFYANSRLRGRTPTLGQRAPSGGERIDPANRSALQSKGGFGANARSTGVGRSVSGGG